MQDDRYQRPRVEDRTTVTEPLNVINTSQGVAFTPAWRSRAAGDEPAVEAYERPGVEEHTPVSEPLNTLTNSNSVPTPTWRTKPDQL
ncbi:MAG TPA: hypothetical protein VG869_05185 [Acidimicrobiia bacterium]|jgi:hypothetical protein|nr:hypothetical protein [Acidimicrobiia bacterium]